MLVSWKYYTLNARQTCSLIKGAVFEHLNVEGTGWNGAFASLIHYSHSRQPNISRSTSFRQLF